MTFKIYSTLADRFGKDTMLYFDEALNPYIQVVPDKIQPVCIFLRYNPLLKFSFFFSISGVDCPENKLVTIAYHMFSMVQKTLCELRISVSRKNPELESIKSIWETAGWFEREVQDCLGINFINPLNTKRILLPDEWIDDPLKENYGEASPYYYREMDQDKLS